jgi:hypothetical protein
MRKTQTQKQGQVVSGGPLIHKCLLFESSHRTNAQANSSEPVPPHPLPARLQLTEPCTRLPPSSRGLSQMPRENSSILQSSLFSGTKNNMQLNYFYFWLSLFLKVSWQEEILWFSYIIKMFINPTVAGAYCLFQISKNSEFFYWLV